MFTKPWPDLTLPQLGRIVRGIGFDGVELPVRPGFQVTPENVRRGLPEAARIMRDCGLVIGSISGPVDEPTIAACGECGVPVNRVMVPIDAATGYRAGEDAARRQFDSVLPLLEKHGVAIGVQNHCGMMIGSALGLMHLIGGYDPKLVGAVLDPAHCGLSGEPDELAIDIAWSHLLFVNLKSGFWERTAGPDVLDAPWRPRWTLGGQGITNWQKIAAELKRRGYGRGFCLHAEYSSIDGTGEDLAGDDVLPLIIQDIRYARSLFG